MLHGLCFVWWYLSLFLTRSLSHSLCHRFSYCVVSARIELTASSTAIEWEREKVDLQMYTLSHTRTWVRNRAQHIVNSILCPCRHPCVSAYILFFSSFRWFNLSFVLCIFSFAHIHAAFRSCFAYSIYMYSTTHTPLFSLTTTLSIKLSFLLALALSPSRYAEQTHHSIDWHIE